MTTPSPAPMTGVAPGWVPGAPKTSTDVTVPKGARFTLDHLRTLLAQADAVCLAGGSLVTHTATMGGKLSGLKVTGERGPAANDTLTAG